MTNEKRVGYAVVGLGRISQVAVLPAFRHSRKAKLVAVVSGDLKKAKRLATRFGASASYTYEDYERCLANPDVEAVFIATDNGTHTRYSVQAARAGRHVLCEKPMARTPDECREMIQACRESNVRLMIAYRKYFEPASLALKKLIAAGKLGRLKLIHSAFTIFLPSRKSVPAWHFDPAASGGGSLVDVGVYCVNTIRWLTGKEPLEASAYSWSTHPECFRRVEESIGFQLKFPDALFVQATSSFGAAQASFLKVFGEKGWAALDPAFAFDEERRLFGKIGGRWFEKRFRIIDEFALELDALADSIRKERDPEPDGLEGLRDVLVMQAIYQAAREGRWVPIDPTGEARRGMGRRMPSVSSNTPVP
ncbi:MAG TPA: Gfo/Idh/MocA family oxidoreductase [Terriglobia bacterium]|nr:Gfo/Idh/MocA family oxidoreductase [Terriglobia bacterium]